MTVPVDSDVAGQTAVAEAGIVAAGEGVVAVGEVAASAADPSGDHPAKRMVTTDYDLGSDVNL